MTHVVKHSSKQTEISFDSNQVLTSIVSMAANTVVNSETVSASPVLQSVQSKVPSDRTLADCVARLCTRGMTSCIMFVGQNTCERRPA